MKFFVFSFISLIFSASCAHADPFLNGKIGELHSHFSKFGNFKKYAASNKSTSYYSSSSIVDVSSDPQFKHLQVVTKTVSKNGYAMETIIFDCNNNSFYTSNRLFYGHDHQVLPKNLQKIIVAPLPFTPVNPNTNFMKLKQLVCGY